MSTPEWKQVLELVGWPTTAVVIDFETYFDSDYSLTKMSTIEYITDKRFEYTGMGYSEGPDGAGMCFTTQPSRRLKNLQERYGDNLERCTVVIANARFDATVLLEKENIHPPYIVDIQDLARAYDARMPHSVKALAEYFKLAPKGNTSDFKGLHLSDMSVEQIGGLEKYCLRDVEIETELFHILLPLLTNPELELPFARHNLGMYLIPRLAFDCVGAINLEFDMENLLNEIIDTTIYTKEELSGSLSFVELLEYELPDGEHVPVKFGKPTKNMTLLLGQPSVIPALAKVDVEFQELLKHKDENVRSVCEARAAVKSWPLHLKKIRKMNAHAIASGGLLRFPSNYHGAHTGRNTGGDGINLLNLGGRGRAGQGNHPLIVKVRHLIKAPDGYQLAIVDSSQIECRFLALVAGQDDLVTGFRNGEDIYSSFATDLFQSPVRKSKEDDPPPVKKLLDIRRGFGKDTTLGSGYGMGGPRFYDNCFANPELRPLFESGEYTLAFCSRCIKKFRTKYAKIPGFWGVVENMFKSVIKYPSRAISYYLPDTDVTLHGHLNSDPTLKNSLFTFWNDNGTVFIQLPSGRCLSYRHAHLDRSGTIKWQWGTLWGGSITENIVQASCRDLLAYWTLECERSDIRVVYHCYDEIVAVVPEVTGEISLQKIDDIMCTAPSWAGDLPLGTDKKLSKEYTK